MLNPIPDPTPDDAAEETAEGDNCVNCPHCGESIQVVPEHDDAARKKMDPGELAVTEYKERKAQRDFKGG